MKTFVSTKTRKGAVIVSCEVSQKFVTIEVPPESGEGEPLHRRCRVEDNFFGRGVPVQGDYFLLYDGGYQSWCPKAEFEAGHREYIEGEESGTDEALVEKVKELEDQVAGLSTTNGELQANATKLEAEIADLTKQLEAAKTPDADAKEK